MANHACIQMSTSMTNSYLYRTGYIENSEMVNYVLLINYLNVQTDSIRAKVFI